MSLPVLIPATGRGRTAAPSGSSNPLEPPMRLELSADAPPPSRAAPVTELRVREVSNQPSPRAVPGSRPAAQAGATGVAARLVWTDAPRQAELHTLEPVGGAGTQDPQPASGQIDSAERGSENALAESNKTRKVQAAPRLRLVASKQPAGAAQLRLASFAPGGDHPASLGRDDSPGSPNEPLLKVRPAAHQGVADAGQGASELNVAGHVRLGPFQIIGPDPELTVFLRSKRLLVCEHEVIEALPEDPNVCRVFWESPGEIVVVGRNVGSTRLHFRLRDAACPTYTCLVRVVVAPDEGSSR